MVRIQKLINSPLPSNCFVVYDKALSDKCIIVDPGGRSDAVLIDFLEKEGLTPQYIILTHEHFDHCWGVNELVDRYHIPIICSALCEECIQSEKRNCSVFYDNKASFVITSKTISVESFDYMMHFGDTVIRFFETPGHTNASVCFTVGHCLFTGDTLIKDLRTVTKLPTGSVTKLQETKELIKKIQGEEYLVYPGHGDVFALDGYDLDMMFKGGIE